MKIFCSLLTCLLLCGCLGLSSPVPEKAVTAPPVQAKIEIKQVKQADFSDKEPQKNLNWMLVFCLAGTLFFIPVVMLKGARF